MKAEDRLAQAMATAHAAEARVRSLETELENANMAHTTELLRHGALETRASEMAEAEASKASRSATKQYGEVIFIRPLLEEAEIILS